MSDGMASGGRDAGVVARAPFVTGEEPGAIVAGFDVHRRQITIDARDTATGEVSRSSATLPFELSPEFRRSPRRSRGL